MAAHNAPPNTADAAEQAIAPSSIGKGLIRLWAALEPSDRRALKWLLFVSVATALAELALLGTVVPFAVALASPYRARAGLGDAALTLQHAGVLFLAAIAVASIMRLVTLRLQVGATRQIAYSLSVQAYSRTLRRPYIQHVATSTSHTMTSLTSRLDLVFQLVIISATSGTSQLVISVAIVGALLLASLWVTLVVLVAVVGAYGMFVYRSRAVVRRESSRHNQSMSRVTRILAESLNGIRDVLLSGSTAQWESAYEAAQHDMRDANAHLSIVAATPRIVVEAVGFAVIIALACFLAAAMPSATGPISILAVVILGSQRLLPVAQGLYVSWNNLNSGLPHLIEILPLLEQPAGVRPTASDPLRLQERLELRSVRYAYPGADRPTIEDASVTIAAGSIVGIVGRTGSGKSTLLDLVMGLLSADSGDLIVDGAPLTSLDMPRWQRCIAHVSQSVYLADASIADNITLGSAAGSLDLVRRAASLAQIAEFVEGLPLGYATEVGERGVRLSGGQRQRIGIARALYRDSDFLILDEATSSLDVATERDVMDALGDPKVAATVLIVTHRISTLARCDSIYRLENGRLEGPIDYAELLREPPGDASVRAPESRPSIAQPAS